jgi:hypothetical protein
VAELAWTGAGTSGRAVGKVHPSEMAWGSYPPPSEVGHRVEGAMGLVASGTGEAVEVVPGVVSVCQWSSGRWCSSSQLLARFGQRGHGSRLLA